ncbi:MAG TPA: ComF family protein [Candidatus Paceibacterota bacterium]|nr:ComF family protein [Candidatus Paceibacterota bacterium]
MALIQKMWAAFLNAVFPPICIACGKRGESPLCGQCLEEIKINNSFFCPECNGRLPEAKNVCHPKAKFVLAAAAHYGNKSVRELVHALKYGRVMAAIEPIGGIIGRYSKKFLKNNLGKIKGAVVIPVPLHFSKKRSRGFNQAELIAEALRQCLEVRSLNIDVNVGEVGLLQIENGNLVRIKNTKSQTKMKDTEERERNVSGAFSLKRPEEISGKNIVLVDDVFTSGATMREAVRVLKEAGARKIIGFVIAKA